MKKLVIAAAMATAALAAAADTTQISAPKVHGVVRGRWEGEWADESHGGFGSRFEVRNARVNVSGALPWNIDYFVQADLCNQGKMQFLDAWGRWEFVDRWKVQAGQFRVPFGVDCFLAPGTYYFANRSFLAKQMMNLRQVGVKLGYYGAGTSFPVDIEAGVFNTASIADHNVWQKSYTYSAKAIWHVGHVNISASFITTKPGDVRLNIADGSVTWAWQRWRVEGEYQHEYYASHRFKAVNAWNLYGVYTLPVNWRAANFWSFEARFDGMTDHSSGSAHSDGLLGIDHQSRRRITAGTTLGKTVKGVKAEVRLDYEKYFYNSNTIAPRGQDDKLVAEFTVKF